MAADLRPDYNGGVLKPTVTISDSQGPDGAIWRAGLWGTFYGAAAAIGYTAANCFLRAASACDPVWVSCIKACPTALVTGIALAAGALAGRRVFPARKTVVALVLAGLFGQLAGNVLFQYALGVVGIGLTVPLCMGMIIIASAILARVYLHESVTHSALVSMTLLIAAIWVLSLGAGDAYQSIASTAPHGWLLFAGVMAACISGVAYAVLGVVIRWGVTGQASVAATTFLVCIVGVISLGGLSYARLGWSGIWQTAPYDWMVMLAAGIFNLIAFLALARALQLTTLVYVNAINASQVAMAAVAGVLLFRESLTTALGIGVTMTVLGLLVMPRQGGAAPRARGRASQPVRECGVQNALNLSSSPASCSSSQSENASDSSTPPPELVTSAPGEDFKPS